MVHHEPQAVEISNKTRPFLMSIRDTLYRAGSSDWQPTDETTDDELVAFALAFFLVRDAIRRDMGIYKMMSSEFLSREQAYNERLRGDTMQMTLFPDWLYGENGFQVLTPTGIRPDELDRIRERAGRVDAAFLNYQYLHDLGLSRKDIRAGFSDETCIDIVVAFRIGLRADRLDPVTLIEPKKVIAEIVRRGTVK